MADARYKQMVVDAKGMDIICSDAITGVKANWLRASLEQSGLDPDNLPPPGDIDIIKSASDAKRWRDIWAAGQGVGAINEVVSIAELVDTLTAEYQAAREG
jgi:nitronate monooxygenase